MAGVKGVLEECHGFFDAAVVVGVGGWGGGGALSR